MSWIDLRSDTVTRPDGPMYEAMRSAPLGDDVLGDDPTVRRLEEKAAEMLGKEAALFVPSGTMGNSIAIAVSTRPGDEVLLEASAHSLLFEVGGGARLWGVQMLPLPGDAGVVPLESIQAGIKPRDIHTPRSSLVILEQTSNLAGGRVLPLPYLVDVAALCRKNGLAFHLDGARIFNAAIQAGIPARDFAKQADTVMFCLSKGLGAPVGSVLTGSAAIIEEARRVRKLLGGGLRQVGILAACGIHALENNVERLANDHANARVLAGAILAEGHAEVRVDPPETNMVYLRIEGAAAGQYRAIVETLRAEEVLCLVVLGRAIRFVFHKDVSALEGKRAGEAVIRVLRKELRNSAARA